MASLPRRESRLFPARTSTRFAVKPRTARRAIVTEEAVLTGGFVPLSRYLKEQPAWSDLPVIVLTTAGEESTERTNALLRVGHVMLVKRPLMSPLS